jgi:hypothetical protein
MAYKSRVTNKYLGNTAGAPSVGKTSELQQVVNTLATSFTPAMQKYGQAYMKDVKDNATIKMEELYASGKSEEEIKNDIMNNVHPELSSRYAQSAINAQLGKFAAAETIQTIITNQDQYSPYGEYDIEGNLTKEPQSLHDFYSQFIPDLEGKDKQYAGSFSAVFNKFKIEQEVKDAQNRAQHWQDKKIQGATNFARTMMEIEGTDFLMSGLDEFQIELPKIDGKKSYFLTNQEKNAVLLTLSNNVINQATTVEELDKGLEVLNLDRGKGKDGQLLGSLSTTNRDDVATLYNQALAKRRTLTNFDIQQEKYQKEQLYISSAKEALDYITDPTPENQKKLTDLYSKLDGVDTNLGSLLRKFTEERLILTTDPFQKQDFESQIIMGTIDYQTFLRELVNYNADEKQELLTLYNNSSSTRQNLGRPIIESDTTLKLSADSILDEINASYISQFSALGSKYHDGLNVAKMRARNYLTVELQKADIAYRAANNNAPMPLDVKANLMETLSRTVIRQFSYKQQKGVQDTPTNVVVGDVTALETTQMRNTLTENVSGFNIEKDIEPATNEKAPDYEIATTRRLTDAANTIFEGAGDMSMEIYSNPEQYKDTLNPVAEALGFKATGELEAYQAMMAEFIKRGIEY